MRRTRSLLANIQGTYLPRLELEPKLFRERRVFARSRLQHAEAEITVNTMADAAGLSLPATEPLLHFARRQDMVCWMIGDDYISRSKIHR